MACKGFQEVVAAMTIKCVVAVARELSAFIWELQNKCKIEIPHPPYKIMPPGEDEKLW